jgi:hypothetical protein
MIQALLPGALTFSLLVAQATTPAPLLSPAPLPSEVTNQKLVWMVKTPESLTAIAKKYYGDEKFWTNIWNANEQVSDPINVKAGTILILSSTIPEDPEELSPKIQELYPMHVEMNIPQTQIPLVTSYVQAASVSASVIPELPLVSPSPTIIPQTSPHTLTDAQITFLGNCEAGMDPARNSGNGYFGAFQFSYGTWKSMGTSYERADLAPLDVQIDAVQRLVARSSIYTQFPGCSRAMHAAGIL